MHLKEVNTHTIKSEIKYRDIRVEDYSLLREFLYQAIFIPEGATRPERSVIDLPEISKYIEDWDEYNDFGLLAFEDDKALGVIWGRKFSKEKHGYGFIDELTPEISMAVDFPYRNKGIGTILLQRIIDLARERGFNKLSLSVDRRNPAYNLYRRTGFIVARETEADYIMTLDL